MKDVIKNVEDNGNVVEVKFSDMKMIDVEFVV